MIKPIDSINVQSKTAEAKFRVPFTVEVVKYEILILAYGKDYSDFDRVDETFNANNPKTLWNWGTETALRTGATIYGFGAGFVNSGVIEPLFFITDLADQYGVNLFDETQYAANSEWRNNLKQDIEEFLETRVSDENADCYYIGKFSGETTELAVGFVCIVGAVKGIVKNVATHSGGIKVVSLVLENGDEALAVVSTQSDDMVMITSKLDDVVKNLDTIFKGGKVSVDDLMTNPKVFSGKSVDEIADAGYKVNIRKSNVEGSKAQIIEILNNGNGKNIAQVQVSPGGGRHGELPYVKISTTDQGKIKIIEGSRSTYKTDGKETATLIFSEGE